MKSSPQPTLSKAQSVDQRKIDVYSTINEMVQDFLTSEFEDFFDSKDTTKTITNGNITITIDLAKLK